MKTIFVPARDSPLVSFQLVSRVGTAVEARGSEGLVCHTAELGMRGAGEHNRQQLNENMDALGARLGFSIHQDSIALNALCLNRHIDNVFDLAKQIITAPQLAKREHEQLRRETLADLSELRDDDASLLSRFFSKYYYPGHIYCRTALGTDQSLAELQLKEIRNLYPRLFPFSDLVLGITGDISEHKCSELIADFPNVPVSKPIVSPDVRGATPPKGRRLIVVDKANRQQCQVAIGHLAPAYGEPHFDRLRVASVAFGGMFTSRLTQEIRVKNGWSYGASCQIYRARGPNALKITMAPAADVCVPAISRVLEMYEQFYSQGLEQQEFEFARSYLVGSAAFSQATPIQRLSRKVQEEVYELSPGYENEFSSRIQSTSRSDINAAIQRWLTPHDLCVVVVANADMMLAKLESIGFDTVEVVDHRSY